MEINSNMFHYGDVIFRDVDVLLLFGILNAAMDRVGLHKRVADLLCYGLLNCTVFSWELICILCIFSTGGRGWYFG